ncbi:MAG: DUF167 domain-containing protein [Candidatus Geothermincolia bacterium]
MEKDQTVLKVKVYTKSSRPRVERQKDGTFKVHVASAPEKGKANADVVKALASHLGVKRAALEIVGGQTSREKLIRLHD